MTEVASELRDAGVSRLEPLPDELHMLAIVAGAERYPWLMALLPSRPVGAVACGNCGGGGLIGPVTVANRRSCGGLGWQSPERGGR